MDSGTWPFDLIGNQGSNPCRGLPIHFPWTRPTFVA